MKKLLIILFAISTITACSDGANDTATEEDTSAGNPSEVHPPAEAITDSTRIVNDSVIVPDTVPNSGAGVNRGDTN